MTRAQIIFTRLLLLVLALSAWEWLPRNGIINPLLLPRSATCWRCWASSWAGRRCMTRSGPPPARSSSPFSSLCRSATAIGILIGENEYAGAVFKPILFYVFSVPKSIFLPMFILVFGIGFQQKVAYAAFTTTFVVLMSATAAVESVQGGAHPGRTLLRRNAHARSCGGSTFRACCRCCWRPCASR